MGSRVSKATVYNTLNLFCERGLLRTVDVDPTRQYYDSSTGAHHHFYNVDTGELTDIPLDSVTLRVDTALPPGTEQAGVESSSACAATRRVAENDGRVPRRAARAKAQAQYAASSNSAGVAQLVEHPLRKRGVGGSSPSAGTTTTSQDIWARRLKRVFGIEIEQCLRCGGRLKVIASIEEPELIERILAHRREGEEAAPRASFGARAPPQASLF